MENELKNLLFIDIETVSNERAYNDMNDRLKSQWDKKANFLRNENQLPSEELYTDRAAIYAEFGKVIVVALGFFYFKEGEPMSMRVKSYHSHDEKELLTTLKEVLGKKFDQESTILCGHNGKEFDFSLPL